MNKILKILHQFSLLIFK